MNVSRETRDLNVYAEHLHRWNRRINLIGKSDTGRFWDRHIADSLLLHDIGPETTHWCDLGSGGGLPGLVIAICRPSTRVTLVESDRRKAEFLRFISRELSLDARICAQRSETLEPLEAKIVSARALAPLGKLIGMAKRHCTENGMFLFPKGVGYKDEIEEARKQWSFDLIEHPRDEGVILQLSSIHRV